MCDKIKSLKKMTLPTSYLRDPLVCSVSLASIINEDSHVYWCERSMRVVSGPRSIEQDIYDFDDFLSASSFFSPTLFRPRILWIITLVHTSPCRRRPRSWILVGGLRPFPRSSTKFLCSLASLPSSNPNLPRQVIPPFFEDSSIRRSAALKISTSTVVPLWPLPPTSPSPPPTLLQFPSSHPFRHIQNVIPLDPLRCTARSIPTRAISTSRITEGPSLCLSTPTLPLRTTRCRRATLAITLFPRLPQPAVRALPPVKLVIQSMRSPRTRC